MTLQISLKDEQKFQGEVAKRLNYNMENEIKFSCVILFSCITM